MVLNRAPAGALAVVTPKRRGTMDEPHRRTFQPLPGVRWSAVATGALLGAAVWLVLLRFGDVTGVLLLEGEPGLGRRGWWVVAPLLAAGVAAWTGVSAS